MPIRLISRRTVVKNISKGLGHVSRTVNVQKMWNQKVWTFITFKELISEAKFSVRKWHHINELWEMDLLNMKINGIFLHLHSLFLFEYFSLSLINTISSPSHCIFFKHFSFLVSTVPKIYYLFARTCLCIISYFPEFLSCLPSQ